MAELDDDIGDPRLPWSRRSVLPRIVRGQSCHEIRSRTNVAALWMIHTPDNVNESLGWIGHNRGRASTTPTSPQGKRPEPTPMLGGTKILIDQGSTGIADIVHLRRALASLAAPVDNLR